MPFALPLLSSAVANGNSSTSSSNSGNGVIIDARQTSRSQKPADDSRWYCTLRVLRDGLVRRELGGMVKTSCWKWAVGEQENDWTT